MLRPVKREPGRTEAGESSSGSSQRAIRARREGDAAGTSGRPGSQDAAGPSRREAREHPSEQGTADRRALRSRYLAVKNLICDERDDISRADSQKFSSIFTQVESLHGMVQKPREQVADAEALLNIANTLMASVKSQRNGVNPSDFVTALLRNFGPDGVTNIENVQSMFPWSDVGQVVSHVCRGVPGCQTMIGPMNSEIKQRKAAVPRKRTRVTERSCPEELDDPKEVQTDTDRNMSTMFDALRKNRRVKLENLVLNRVSFAQTVENIFALSFLVKDGRAEISVDDSGNHLVSPRNAPAATAVASRNVSYNHFVFRYDYKDWKLMTSIVTPGEELMPHRSGASTSGSAQTDPNPTIGDSESAAPTTPIRKFTRNRGLVIQEQCVVDTPERESSGREASLKRKGKRLTSSP